MYLWNLIKKLFTRKTNSPKKEAGVGSFTYKPVAKDIRDIKKPIYKKNEWHGPTPRR